MFYNKEIAVHCLDSCLGNWYLIGKRTPSCDLGINSHSFLLVSVSDLGKPFPNWYVSLKIVMSGALLLFLCQNHYVLCFKLPCLCQNCYVSYFIGMSMSKLLCLKLYCCKEVPASWVHPRQRRLDPGKETRKGFFQVQNHKEYQNVVIISFVHPEKINIFCFMHKSVAQKLSLPCPLEN